MIETTTEKKTIPKYESGWQTSVSEMTAVPIDILHCQDVRISITLFFFRVDVYKKKLKKWIKIFISSSILS